MWIIRVVMNERETGIRGAESSVEPFEHHRRERIAKNDTADKDAQEDAVCHNKDILFGTFGEERKCTFSTLVDIIEVLSIAHAGTVLRKERLLPFALQSLCLRILPFQPDERRGILPFRKKV